jgi:hypothetical protein
MAAGAYNTTLGKWTDFSRQYDNVAMEFRWAPYVTNLTESINKMMNQERQPDLVVIGGGAWDRLHTYGTKEEQETFQRRVDSLATLLRLLREDVPVAWVAPTTINTWALASEDKRENIREDQMAEFRLMYQDKGVLAASSFVLDGPSFTHDRVSESYDGVHYPLSVYDGGAQMLANAFDWLLPENTEISVQEATMTPLPGSMHNPWLGLIMLCFVFVGLFFFDGFMGISYVAAVFVPSLVPAGLYEEAFAHLHGRMGLPAHEMSSHDLSNHTDDLDKSKNSDAEDLDLDAEADTLLLLENADGRRR